MAIKGLTTRKDLTPRFPRIGKLRKGGPRPQDSNGNGTGYGKDLEFFRFTSDRPEVERAFAESYGQKPVLIHAYLPYPTMEQNFASWKEEWGAGGLKHRCDGERTVIWQDEKGEYVTEPEKQKPCPGKCDEVGYLSLIIPELVAAGFVGTVTLETHSINDLLSISESLLQAEELSGNSKYGLRGILFIMRRVLERISTPGFGKNAGKRQRVQKWLVKLEPAQEWVQSQLQAMERLALAANQYPQLGETTAYVTDGSEQYARLDEDQMEALINQSEAIRRIPQRTPEEQIEAGRRASAMIRGTGRPDPFDDAPEDVEDGEYYPADHDDELSPAEQIRQYLQRAAAGEERQPSEKQLGYCRGSLDNLCNGNDAKRHAITLYLFGKTSTKDLTAGECSALIDWIGSTKQSDGTWVPGEQAVKEANILAQAQALAEGQMPLLAEGEDPP